jgi:hypothetical protein
VPSALDALPYWLAAVLLVLWLAPTWARRVLGFLRDWDEYRAERHREIDRQTGGKQR